MTTLVLNYSTNLLEGLFKTLTGTLASIMIGWRDAKQRSANRTVAAIMIQHAKSDYPGYTVEALARELDERQGLNK